jgi:hypothetical protein
MLRFMTKHLALVSCPVDGASRTDGTGIMILPCAPGAAGGFGPNEPREHSAILICGNRMMDKGHLEDTLAHEMTHFWDHCRFKVDWDDLRHVACSEVRGCAAVHQTTALTPSSLAGPRCIAVGRLLHEARDVEEPQLQLRQGTSGACL